MAISIRIMNRRRKQFKEKAVQIEKSANKQLRYQPNLFAFVGGLATLHTMTDTNFIRVCRYIFIHFLLPAADGECHLRAGALGPRRTG